MYLSQITSKIVCSSNQMNMFCALRFNARNNFTLSFVNLNFAPKTARYNHLQFKGMCSRHINLTRFANLSGWNIRNSSQIKKQFHLVRFLHCNRTNTRKLFFQLNSCKSNSHNSTRTFINLSANLNNVNYTLLTIAALSLLYMLAETFLIGYYYKHFVLIYDGKPVRLTNELLKLASDTLETSDIKSEYKLLEMGRFIITQNIQPFYIGTFLSRFGTYFAIPFNFNYDDANSIDVQCLAKLLNLDLYRLETTSDENGISMLEKLKQTLVLSDKAKKFALMTQTHSSTLPTQPYLNMATLMLFPGFGNFVANKLFGNGATSMQPNVYRMASSSIRFPIVNILAISAGYALATAINYYFKYIQTRYGYWAVFFHEFNNEHKCISNQDLYDGGEEYLNKLQELQKILYEYSTVKPKNLTVMNGKQVECKDFLSQYTTYPIEQRIMDVKKFSKNVNQLSYLDLFR